MNPFISINGFLAQEEIDDNIQKMADEHGVSFKVMEEYLDLKSKDPDDFFGEADEYLKEQKELANE